MKVALRLGLPALVAAALLAGAAPARAGGEPDLVPELPAFPYPGQVAPVFVDRFAEPGKLLYRFDAILRNQGGTLDLFRDADSGKAMQAIWAGGVPTTDPHPNVPPPEDGDVTLEDRSEEGGSFEFVVEPDHAHWHFFDAARYELLVPGGADRVSQKIGFCLFDSFDLEEDSNYFPPGGGWCNGANQPDTFVHMGLSPGAGDRYRSQLHLQWVDMTGLAPGRYTLRATANPVDVVHEADTTNNALEQGRTIPGTTAADVSARIPGAPAAVPLEGAVVGASIPARRAANCSPGQSSTGCYVWATENGPLTFRVERPPVGGSVTVGEPSGSRGTATYTQNPGFSGSDSFTYTATDARGLQSAPATATLEVEPARPAAKPRALVSSAAIRRRGGRWHAVLRLSTAARVSGRLIRASRTTKLLRSRRLKPGRRTLSLGRLGWGSYRLRLRVSAAGRSQLVKLAFRVGR